MLKKWTSDLSAFCVVFIILNLYYILIKEKSFTCFRNNIYSNFDYLIMEVSQVEKLYPSELNYLCARSCLK